MKKSAFFIFFLSLFSQAINASVCQERFDFRSELLKIDCPFFSTEIAGREVLWSVGKTYQPYQKMPVVILSQGSWFPVEFSRYRFLPFGGFHEVRLIQKLLDAGFVVIAPRAIGKIAWTTNITLRDYRDSADFHFFQILFQRIEENYFADVDLERIFATGVSSGGYNSSRLASIFPGQIRALAIQSASFRDCLGPFCEIPDTLGDSHPPTFFLHGKKDRAVPISTAKEYHRVLFDMGVETKFFTDPEAGHGWLESSPELITEWFIRHL